MQLRVQDINKWTVVAIFDRVDAFTDRILVDKIEGVLRGGQSRIALDLEHTKFLSLTTMRYLGQVAARLKTEGGALVLLSPTEKLKRQIDSFASLESMAVFRSVNEWQRRHTPPVLTSTR